MKLPDRIATGMIISFLLISLVGFSGCKGTETREAVDDTVAELSGKKNVERMKQMKEDIAVIQDQNKARYDQLDVDAAP